VAQVRKRWDSYGASNIARQTLAKQKIELVYGSNVGLMRAVADGALNAGGTVIGVLPDFKSKSWHTWD
jgi:predicted Rossmann-fold nucleotide-binding protein